MPPLTSIFKPESRFRAFFVSIVTFAFAYGLYKGVIDNYLAEVVEMKEFDKGVSEFFRELPGFLLVFVLAVLYFFSAENIYKIGAVIMLTGMTMLTFVPSTRFLVTLAIFVYSLGEHIQLGMRNTLSLQYSKEGRGGLALGVQNSVYQVGTLLGFFAVIAVFLVFGKSTSLFRPIFGASAGIIALGAIFSTRMNAKSTTDKSKRRFYFRKKFTKYYMLEVFYGARKQIFFTFGPYVLVLFYGANAMIISLLFAVSAICCFFASPIVGKIIDRLGYKIVMISDTLILVIVCFFYGFSHHIFPRNVAFVICCVNYILDSVISLASMASNVYVQDLSDSSEEVRATISTGVSVNHLITILIALFGGWIWKVLGIETLFVLSAVLGLCNSAYAATIKTKKKQKKAKTLTVAGIGSGKFSQITGEVLEALKICDCIVGYEVYINLVKSHFPGKEFLSTPMRKEEERCRLALEQANSGKNVVFICSGDSGVYGMAGLIYEVARDFPEVQINVLPGITAALSGASILGAPLIHDFAVISLSDLMTPWEKIEKRLEGAGLADFCIVLYNPMSHKRKDYLFKACGILLKNLSPETPCGYVKNIGREGEESNILSLKELQNAELDMFTTVFIGNSTTRIIDTPDGKKLVTPRGYKIEKESASKEPAKSVFIFAGTTEGRELSEKLSESGFDCTVSVATEYGENLLPKKENLTVLQGRMNSEEMAKAFSQKNYAFVVDATHPFATEVSKEIKKACNNTEIRYLRLARNTESGDDFSSGTNQKGEIHFSDISSAAEWLESQSGKIFVSTGSKELPKLCEKITDKTRLVVRILPSVESLKICSECKIPQSQIIAMQGPFSEKANELQFEESGAEILLTKESGATGGYFEKIEAAQKLGMKIAVIENPEKIQAENAHAGSLANTSADTQGKTATDSEIFHSVGEICGIIEQSK